MGIIETVYRLGNGQPYAVRLAMSDGNAATVHLGDGHVSWADPDVWAYPERYGLERWYCPGHNGRPCYYGACDMIRTAGGPPVLDLASL